MKTQEVDLAISADLESLKGFVHALNNQDFWLRKRDVGLRRSKASVKCRPIQTELHRLVQGWFDSGPNVNQLFSAHPELAKQAASIHAHVIATQTPRAKLLYTPAPANMSPLDQHFVDYGLFFGFLVNPFNERLGGPCANCGQHFVKNTKRRKTRYCSPRCGKLCTSRLANQNRRRSERRRQLRDVRRAIQEWRKEKCKLVWKEWVSRRTQVSKNWITRAVKSGDISEPGKR